MNIKRAMALAGLLGTGMLASAPAAALDLTCGGACPWVTYGDGNSFLLQYNAYIYDKLNGGGVGPGNPYYINSTPGAIKDLTVIGTGTSSNPATTNTSGMDDAYPTPNSSGIPYFSTGTTADPNGANEFTGDGAGPLLFGTLTELGMASRPQPVRIADHPSTIRADDGLQLHGCRISNAVKCLPPDNKPLPVEIRTCNRFMAAEIEAMRNLRVIVALGKVAHDAVLMALGQKASAARFAHAAEHRIAGYTLIDSYHCSRYNQNTGRLTAPMFRAVFERAAQILELTNR